MRGFGTFLLLPLTAVLIWQCGVETTSSAQEDPVTPVVTRGPFTAQESATIALFEQAAPSVVHIHTTEVRRQLFSTRVSEEFTGNGSGFLWDAEGHVVTNYHVIKDANRAFVTLADGRNLEASLVGAEPRKDIAVLRIDLEDQAPPVLPLGRSMPLKVGQSVFAIGNPFGLDQTLTTGIISGLDREIIGIAGNRLRQVIQTDAAINPGNSGGPLLDSAGLLIGVNTAIKSPSGASAGVGFAIPVDTVRLVVEALIRDGEVPHATLGLNVLPSRWSRARQIPGLVVAAVQEDGPAAQAGIKAAWQNRKGRIQLGDLLLQLGQFPLRDDADFDQALASYEPGEEVVLVFLRDGEEQRLTLRLAANTELED